MLLPQVTNALMKQTDVGIWLMDLHFGVVQILLMMIGDVMDGNNDPYFVDQQDKARMVSSINGDMRAEQTELNAVA